VCLEVKLIDKSSIYGTARGARQSPALWPFAEGLFSLDKKRIFEKYIVLSNGKEFTIIIE
jgi:hypothetical protein